MQFFLDGIDSDPVGFQVGGIVAGFYRDGILLRLPIRQVMEKQGALMGKNRLGTTEVEQVHASVQASGER